MTEPLPAFTYDAPSPRVLFGSGARTRVAEEADRLQLERLLLVCTPGRSAIVAELERLLDGRGAGVFDGARQHVPADVVAHALRAAEVARADAYLSVGGGSATGLAKALALTTGLPVIAIPTTYAGSEVTPMWGITEGGRKTTGHDQRVLPRVVIYDAELTLDLPPGLAGPSGLNAMAHCVEALYAPDANPVTSLLAEEGMRAVTAALPAVVRHPADIRFRERMLYGSWLGGTVLAAVSMGPHHRLCHLLGGAFDLPHAATHAVLLPHVVAYESRDNDIWVERAAKALAGGRPANALHDLRTAVGAPQSLQELGLTVEGLDRAISLGAGVNDRGGQRLGDEARTVLEDAYFGRPPRDWQ
jgi:maleylacetate reductase